MFLCGLSGSYSPKPAASKDLCLALYTFEVCGMLYMRHWAGPNGPNSSVALRELNVSYHTMDIWQIILFGHCGDF